MPSPYPCTAEGLISCVVQIIREKNSLLASSNVYLTVGYSYGQSHLDLDA